MRRKMTAASLIVLLFLILLLSPAAYAGAPGGDAQWTAPQAGPSAEDAEGEPRGTTGGTSAAPNDPAAGLGALLKDMDPEVLEFLKAHPGFAGSVLPKLSLTAGEDYVKISFSQEKEADRAGRTGTVATDGGSLFVRSGPGREHAVLMKLPNGAGVEVLGEEAGWYRVKVPSAEGYVWGGYLRVQDTPVSSPEEVSVQIPPDLLLSLLGSHGPGETQPEEPEGLTPDGNLSLLDDLGERSGAGQQFVTLVTRNGNCFYLIIDRDDKGTETVHFLNMVDERDLLSLMEEDDASMYEKQLAELEAARQAAEKAAAEASAVLEGREPEEEPQKENAGPASLLLLLIPAAAAGGGWLYLRAKKKKQASRSPDPDAGYTEEDDEDPFENEILDFETGTDAERKE